ncbi:hypothetical protein [Rhizobium laguerreae]|nr:hypothetical protein [Rhizobium laguerreae]
MEDGNQGPGWWFAWVGRLDTNIGMLRFLSVPICFIVVFGTIMWTILP